MQTQNEHFEGRGKFISLWKIRSDELYQSASLVWDGGTKSIGIHNGQEHKLVELYRPACLLMGMCLEALLKGLIIQRRGFETTNGKLPDDLKTHSIERLCELASITLMDNEEELNFVRKLSESVEWISKYPVPTKAGHLKTPKHKAKSDLIRNDRDFERFELLRSRILDAFDE